MVREISQVKKDVTHASVFPIQEIKLVLDKEIRVEQIVVARMKCHRPDMQSGLSRLHTFYQPIKIVRECNLVTAGNFRLGKVGGLPSLPRTLQYTGTPARGGVNIYVTAGLEAGASYTVSVSGVKDMTGNMIPNGSPVLWTFSVQPPSRVTAIIDSFDTPPVQWKQPMAAMSFRRL